MHRSWPCAATLRQLARSPFSARIKQPAHCRQRGPHWSLGAALLGLALLGGCSPAPVASPARSQNAAATAPGGAPAANNLPAATSAPAPPRQATLKQIEPGLTVGLSVTRAGADKGFFAEEGLEMEFSAASRGDTRTAAMVSGDVQILLGTAEDVIRAQENGLDFTIVAGLLNGITYNIVAQPRYRTLAELRGGTIGVVDLTSGSSVVLFEIMQANGLELNRDYQALVVGGASDRVTALRAGAIDATTLPVPDSTRVIEEGFANLGDAADYIQEYQNSPLSVRTSWAAANRDLLVRYLRAYLRTLDWTYTQRDEFVAIAARLLSLDPKYAAVGWELYTSKQIWPRDGRPTLPGIAKIIDILNGQNTFAGRPPPPAMQFVDTSYIEEAQRTLAGQAR